MINTVYIAPIEIASTNKIISNPSSRENNILPNTCFHTLFINGQVPWLVWAIAISTIFIQRSFNDKGQGVHEIISLHYLQKSSSLHRPHKDFKDIAATSAHNLPTGVEGKAGELYRLGRCESPEITIPLKRRDIELMKSTI